MITNVFSQEVYRLSYAIFRAVESVRQEDIKREIESSCICLITDVFSGKEIKAAEDLVVLRTLIAFANDTGFMGYKTRISLLEKVGLLEDELKGGAQTETDVDDLLRLIVPPPISVFSGSKIVGKNSERDGGLGVQEDNGAVSSAIRQNVEFGNPASSCFAESSVIKDDSYNRRDRVFTEVAKKEVCFLRDLLSCFPDYSERTIRYDLEALIRDRRIEKIGSSGPGTFYRVIRHAE